MSVIEVLASVSCDARIERGGIGLLETDDSWESALESPIMRKSKLLMGRFQWESTKWRNISIYV